jgi:hypothetical protein
MLLGDIKVDVLQGGHAPKVFGQSLDLQNLHVVS